MPLFRSREVAIAVAGLSLMVALSAAATILAPPADNLPPGSSLSKGPAGSAAAYQTLAGLGYNVSRSFDAVQWLKADAPNTLLVLADPAEDASVADRRAMQALVSAGAVVIATGCHGGSFFSDGTPSATSRAGADRFAAVRPSALTEGAPEIAMETYCLRSDLAARFEPVYAEKGRSVVGVAHIGRGVAMWWAGNTPVTNRAIDSPGHLELLLNAVGEPGRTILWDEFYHGQRRSLYSYARQTPLPWLGAQLALIAVVAGAMYVRRRAPVLERVVEPRVSPLEFVETMGGLYARGEIAWEAVATARARLRRVLLETTGLSISADDERLAAAAAGRLRIDAKELAAALAEAGRYERTGSINSEEALALVQRLQTLSAAVDRTGG